jgi:hypothetical protein
LRILCRVAESFYIGDMQAKLRERALDPQGQAVALSVFPAGLIYDDRDNRMRLR